MSQCVRLYHASRAGINGAPSPFYGRETVDFGQGFYLGTDELQTKMLCANAPSPVYYEYVLELAQLSTAVFEPDLSWAFSVALHRGRLPETTSPEVVCYLASLTSDKDVIIAPIANDRLFDTLSRYFEGSVTDKALVAAMDCMRLGTQYVLKTPEACAKLTLVNVTRSTKAELQDLQTMANRNRATAKAATEMALTQYRRSGNYIDESLQELEQSLRRHQPHQHER